MNRRYISVAIGTIGAVSFGAYTYINRSFVEGKPRYQELRRPNEQHRTELYNMMAPNYDKYQDEIEKSNGILPSRKKLANYCKGHVLEIGSATGRNLDYMISNKKIKSLTFIEKSPEMCNLLKNKIELKSPPFPIQILECDAEDIPFVENSFDTVLSTYALCSLEHANVGLKEIHRVLDTHGRCLLLEPGSINWSILRQIMQLFKIYPNPRIPWEYGYFEDLDIIGLLESNHFIIKDQWYKNLRSIYITFAGIKPHSKLRNNDNTESIRNNFAPSPRVGTNIKFEYYPEE